MNGLFIYEGFDVSFYQDNDETPQGIDFHKMKEYGASFVIIKAGQYTYKDEDFDYNWKHSKEAGIPRSAYWFGDKDSSGKSQAQLFWDIVKNDPPEGMLFIDYEDGSWTDWNQLYNFITELQRLSGYPNSKIGIYTGYYYWFDHSPFSNTVRDWFKKYSLWLASYTTKPEYVKVPAPWVECLIWQDYTPAIGGIVGVESKEVDHNLFNGDEDKFRFYLGGTPIAPPDGGEEMTALYYADLKAGYESNVRPLPDLQSGLVQVITGPITVSIISEKTTEDGYDWYKINYPATGWIAMTTSYTNFRKATTTTEDYPVKVTVQMNSGKVFVSEDLVEQ